MNMPAATITSPMTLAELLRGYADAPAILIDGIASNTQGVHPGYAFLACRGTDSHGLDHIAKAIDAGAIAVAYDATTATAVPQAAIPLIPVQHLRGLLGDIANRFFGNPSQSVNVLGVTGTNGKTTVAWLLAQCLRRLGKTCGYAGTLGYGVHDIEGNEGMTTPDAVELHRRLGGFRDAGASHAAIEVSSHALAQGRIDGVGVDTALFTNLGRDHLDYHGDMQAYAQAKAALFTDADPKRRIVNIDSEFGAELAKRCGPDVVTVTTDAGKIGGDQPHVFVRSRAVRQDGSEFTVGSSWGDGSVRFPLPGDFNIANAALVLAYLLSDGVTVEDAVAVLSEVEAPPGRMQRVAAAGGPTVYVDYAHTPDALEAVLRALRPHCRGELWCVFGCGGDRDPGKRPLMARAAEALADHIVITSDNPRDEKPGDIITAIVDGLRDSGRATVIEDRAAAIARAIRRAESSDLILLAGKGHESHQLIGRERRAFSDYGVAATNLLARSRHGEGAP